MNVICVPPAARLYATFGSCNTPPTDTIIAVSSATAKSNVKVTVLPSVESVCFA